ncbi:MAG TPA: cysteine--tRNA ligase [Candidatus Peribacteraceae bacterium]|nr:cysteine--tRNA ligase [Candidatus Peribacteraceae bacterium]
MPLKLYNTFSKGEEEFVPLEKGKVRMYTCGPTVYGRPHIGNYSSFLMADLLRRWLEVSGYEVTHVKNITDVGHLLHDADQGDDKIQREAEKSKGGGGAARVTWEDVMAVVEKHTNEFLEDEKALNILDPWKRPRASEFVAEQLAMIKTMLQSGHAYETDDGIYFSVQSFPQYGALSGNTIDKLSAGARIAVDERKKHPADFALWKKCVGDNARHVLRWTFATGKRSDTVGEDEESGFPGWHIECSAMSSSLLGGQIDIHTGGEDNIFPHHECEIAQSECSGPAPFVKYWVHKRRIAMPKMQVLGLGLGKEKMSKSIGNVLSVPDIQAMGYSPLDLRYYFLSVHYRTQLKFTKKGLSDAHQARRRVMDWMSNDGMPRYTQIVSEREDVRMVEAIEINRYKNQFIDAMDDDLNTPGALAALFGCMNYCNGCGGIGSNALGTSREFINIVRHTFGCFDPREAEEIPAEVRKLANLRAEARAAKNFKESDRLRDEMAALGYEVRDTAEGQKITKM